jgi:DNA helicase-2/ATP-dependent DNA helicase PcrA
VKPVIRKAPTPPPTASFSVGDRVRHKAFGDGTVAKVTPMGNDALLEISFPSVGTKKLMLRTASVYMEKV